MSNVLALDLGVATGICRVTENGRLISYSVEVIAPWQRGTPALAVWKAWIEAELSAHDYSLVVIEDYARGTSVMREESGERCGVFKLAAFLAGVPVLMVNQSQVKKWAYGNTKDKDSDAKQEVRSRAEREFGYDLVKNDHNSDSLYLAQIGLCFLGKLSAPFVYRRDVLNALQIKAASEAAAAEKLKNPIHKLPIARTVKTSPKTKKPAYAAESISE